ncbi:sodium-independent anion transporter [Microbulbifer sp. A4B17]|uniref:SulP family inorganic anion transporter n=1 Tax=Microbulbifer sp. A4B17 TaxID=359370 RepID=UPI000D52B6FD|nr:sulfate permease [Microbulbifer sp. A4B17]AWF81968.1 sodium-independent anion transporter [Microbulbifer sp. A4B17]
MAMQHFTRWFPILATIHSYNRQLLTQDLLAALIVTVLLIPQSLAYALLAGLPAEVGFYASIVPLVVYGLFGSSQTLSVGPVAVISLMSATALGEVTASGEVDHLTAAAILALLSGGILTILGVLKLGFLANFLSHSVISGFITASALLIALNQIAQLLGLSARGDTLLELLPNLFENLSSYNQLTLLVGLGVVLFLYLSRACAAQLLKTLGIEAATANLLAKSSPAIAVLITIYFSYAYNLEAWGVALVGSVPSGLPQFTFPKLSVSLLESLALPALMIAIIGYVESISVAKTLAAKRRQRIDSNQELVALGLANMGAGFSGGFPVSGGFSRSVVNADAGAQTQFASLFTALGIGFTALFFTSPLYFLPKATLAATIIVAVLSLVDFSILRKTWKFSKADFLAVSVTILVTLLFGVESGVLCGVAASLMLFFWRASKPHIAEVGLVEGTEHFRNIDRHPVKTASEILTFRVDGRLIFSNIGILEERIYTRLVGNFQVKHVILMCSAVNEIDWSALEVLGSINTTLASKGIRFHLSEVKGPVMDRLEKSSFLQKLSGEVFLSQYQAFINIQVDQGGNL